MKIEEAIAKARAIGGAYLGLYPTGATSPEYVGSLFQESGAVCVTIEPKVVRFIGENDSLTREDWIVCPADQLQNIADGMEADAIQQKIAALQAELDALRQKSPEQEQQNGQK